MKNSSKIILVVLVIAVLILFIFNKPNGEKEEKEIVSIESTIESTMYVEVIENTAYLKDSKEVTHDILTISSDYGVILELNNIGIENEVIASKKFIKDYDVNFDGIKDVAVLDGIGYGGVNFFYNYFIVNEETKKFEDYRKIPHVSNFIFDNENKVITSVYRSGPEWFTDEYVFEGEGYTRIENK
jgi:hypothetical protein